MTRWCTKHQVLREDVTILTFKGFQLSAWNLVTWCTVAWSKLLFKMAKLTHSWWRHQMETFFRVTGPLCGEFTGPGEFPTQRPVTWGFDVFFDLRLNKWLSKLSWGWWFETPSWSLWRQCNVLLKFSMIGLDEANNVGRPRVLLFAKRVVWWWTIICYQKACIMWIFMT